MIYDRRWCETATGILADTEPADRPSETCSRIAYDFHDLKPFSGCQANLEPAGVSYLKLYS